MVDHLRYPCKDTLFYVYMLVALYPQLPEMNELIVRAVIERQLSYQPHPWGLQLAISELNKNISGAAEKSAAPFFYPVIPLTLPRGL